MNYQRTRSLLKLWCVPSYWHSHTEDKSYSVSRLWQVELLTVRGSDSAVTLHLWYLFVKYVYSHLSVAVGDDVTDLRCVCTKQNKAKQNKAKQNKTTTTADREIQVSLYYSWLVHILLSFFFVFSFVLYIFILFKKIFIIMIRRVFEDFRFPSDKQ